MMRFIKLLIILLFFILILLAHIPVDPLAHNVKMESNGFMYNRYGTGEKIKTSPKRILTGRSTGADISTPVSAIRAGLRPPEIIQ